VATLRVLSKDRYSIITRNEPMSMNGKQMGVARMPQRSAGRAVVGMIALLGLLPALGCAKLGAIKAMMNFKEANQAYQKADYKRAVELYEETVQNDPSMASVYFFLGNSYDNLWKPGVETPANQELLNKAVKNYEMAAEKIQSDDPATGKIKKLAMQYLVAAYGSDKLNDPVKAEPVVQRIIQIDPGEPANYYALANIYEQAGEYAAAENVLLRAKQAKPSDPTVYTTLAGFYNRQGEFDKTIQALVERSQKEPNNPEAFYTISTYYWDKAYRDARLKDAEKRNMVDKGIEAIDTSLKIKPDYMEALVYKNLLLRLAANLEKDTAKQQALIKQADQLREKAEQLRKLKAQGN
jgi:tetratricopeptide (TPR) repeat protein